MNKQAVIISFTLFILVVVGMFVFAYLKKQELREEADVKLPVVEVEDDRYGYINRIEGKHFYIDGVHTVVGEIPMPTPCDLLEGDAIVAESFPEQITLDFKVINNADFCAQIITPQRFKISATASEGAAFKALFNNRMVELNLIEADPGETPEDFELFIKG
jgi:hypothetical protein